MDAKRRQEIVAIFAELQIDTDAKRSQVLRFATCGEPKKENAFHFAASIEEPNPDGD